MSEEELTELAYANLLDTLSYLASIKAQEKYIIGGTEEEYIVPEDLLEDFLIEVDFFKFEKFPNRINWLKSKASEKGFMFIEDLYTNIEDSGLFFEKYTHANIAGLVNDDPVWLKLRDKSAHILNLCDFDLEAWEKKNA